MKVYKILHKPTGLFFTPADDDNHVEIIISGTVVTSSGADVLAIRLNGILDGVISANIVESNIPCGTTSSSFTTVIYGKVSGGGDIPFQLKSVGGDTITLSNLKISIKTFKPLV
jgi:hypothetical protein